MDLGKDPAGTSVRVLLHPDLLPIDKLATMTGQNPFMICTRCIQTGGRGCVLTLLFYYLGIKFRIQYTQNCQGATQVLHQMYELTVPLNEHSCPMLSAFTPEVESRSATEERNPKSFSWPLSQLITCGWCSRTNI